MARQVIMWILIFTVCGVTPVILAKDKFYCHNLQYAGPIKDVITMKPTKLAEKTSNAAKIGIGFAKTMISNTIGEIPAVGSILSALFDELADVFGLGGGLDPEDVYNSLKAEIDKLKEYMDQEILEAKLENIKNAFGTRNGGILSYAMYCQKTYKNDAQDMAPCLENVNAMLTSHYHNFLLEDGKPVSVYESSLPLFRMYGQLYVDTLLELIGAARKRGKESQAAAQADTLINKVARFKKYYEKSFNKIEALHTKVRIMPEDNGGCGYIPGADLNMCVCSLGIGPNKFDEAEIKKKGKSLKNWCVGIYFKSNIDPCSWALNAYNRTYAIIRKHAIQSYWKKQVGEAVENWVKMADELKPLKENMKRSLSYRERIQFDQEVAAYHARVNHGKYLQGIQN